jgi:hypothetical protein
MTDFSIRRQPLPDGIGPPRLTLAGKLSRRARVNAGEPVLNEAIQRGVEPLDRRLVAGVSADVILNRPQGARPRWRASRAGQDGDDILDDGVNIAARLEIEQGQYAHMKRILKLDRP